jgi:hypothetical protein
MIFTMFEALVAITLDKSMPFWIWRSCRSLVRRLAVRLTLRNCLTPTPHEALLLLDSTHPPLHCIYCMYILMPLHKAQEMLHKCARSSAASSHLYCKVPGLGCPLSVRDELPRSMSKAASSRALTLTPLPSQPKLKVLSVEPQSLIAGRTKPPSAAPTVS